MFQVGEIIPRLFSLTFWAAEIPSELSTPANSTLNFSGAQGFLVLIAGIFLALAFQLLLTNFFIALGISYTDTEKQSDADSEDDLDSLDNTINRVGTVVGLRTLGTISITLFGACFLAVKLCLAHDPVLGAILGLVIWAAYLSLLLWVSSTTVSSVIGTVVSTATSGLQGIVGTAAVAIGAKNVSEQVVSTAEVAAATVKRELNCAVDPASTRKAIDNYLKKLRLPEADRHAIEAEFVKLVADPEMKAIARDNHLRNMGRETFVDLVHSRTEFSKQEISQAVDQVQTFWQQLWGQQQQKVQQAPNAGLLDALKPAPVEEPQSAQLTTKLEQLIEKTRAHQAQQQAEATQKVAETAAWWLFATAFTSAASSAIAGALALKG